MQPNDYNTNFVNPATIAMQAIRKKREEERRDKQFGLQDRRINIAENEAAVRATALAKSEQEKAEGKATWANFVRKENKTPEERMNFIAENPEWAERAIALQGSHSKAKMETYTTDAKKLLNSLRHDDDGKAALAILDERIQAAENAGDEKELAATKALKLSVEANPEAVKEGLMMNISLAVGGTNAAAIIRELRLLDGGGENQNSKQDIARQKALGSGLGLTGAEVNRIMVTHKDNDARVAAMQEKAEGKKGGKAKKLRKVTTAESTALFAYGEEIGLDGDIANSVAAETAHLPYSKRRVAFDKALKKQENPDEPTADEVAKGIAANKGKKAKGKNPPEGYEITNPATGSTLIWKNGQYVIKGK